MERGLTANEVGRKALRVRVACRPLFAVKEIPMPQEPTVEDLKKELEEWKEFGEMMANNYNTVSEWHSEAQDWLEKAAVLLKDLRTFLQKQCVCTHALFGQHMGCQACAKKNELISRMIPFFPEEA